MKRRTAVAIAACAALAFGVLTATSLASNARQTHASCSSGYVDAIIGGQHKCLHAGEFCSASAEADYERYGFRCVDGHLQSGSSTPTPTATTTTVATSTAATTTTPTAVAATTTTAASTTADGPISLGKTVKLASRTKTSGCKRRVLPDRRCSPGAYYSGLTTSVICAPSFRTGVIRNVPQSEKSAVEIEYGMAARSYGRTIEIDHIVSLELGGSNDIANLFPESGSGKASYHVKDKLENKLHSLVCSGQMTLATARRGIAANWETLYKQVFGVAP